MNTNFYLTLNPAVHEAMGEFESINLELLRIIDQSVKLANEAMTAYQVFGNNSQTTDAYMTKTAMILDHCMYAETKLNEASEWHTEKVTDLWIESANQLDKTKDRFLAIF